MGENVRGIMDDNSGQCMAPVLHQANYDANVDYVINEYMERLGTRINILETELKYAWRALDLLSQEYIKMWERLEKLEGLLYEQQSVISQLLNFYTTGGCPPDRGMPPGASAMLEGRLGELEVIREILGNGTVEDGLEEGLDVTRTGQVSVQELEMDEMHPDEAFYRSLNQAYREDLDPSQSGNQLGMIWEEGEDGDDADKKLEINEIEESLRLEQSQEIYSAMDYKDYRGNSPCVSEQDIAQLSRIDSIDHVAIEKLNELDRLSSKLRQDSANIKHLQRKLMESPLSMSGINEEAIENKQIAEKRSIDDQIKQIYSENENWSFSSNVRDQDDLIMLATADLNAMSNYSSTTRPSSRLSVSESVIGTDNEVAEVLAGGRRTPTSPRRRGLEVTTCNAPFTTVTGRLAYSAAVQNVECAEAAAAAAAAQASKNPFYCSTSELNSLIAASYETVPCSTPNIFSIKSEKAPSPTLSICSIRTRQDGYIGNNETPKDVSTINQSPSPPPPPAPRDMVESYLLPNSALNVISTQAGPSQVFLAASDAAASSSIIIDHGRLSPKSPKSPRTSPKRSKSRSSNIVAAKSDSGLSSMSGWSSLEKSPGSPKNAPNKAALNYYADIRQLNNRPISPAVSQSIMVNSRPFMESSVDSKISENSVILPGGHPLSAFTSVKSPCSLETAEGYGNFVPAPAPASDINVSPRRKSKHAQQHQQQLLQQHQQLQQQQQERNAASDYLFKNDQSTPIYSVAGNNKDSYTTVYTSNSADYINQTINYPDLVEPYENNEFFNAQQRHFYNTTTPATDATTQRRRSLTRSYSTSKGPETLANHEGYKTAMYRTMFPTGNITDALSYYPTSSRYDSAMANIPPQDYNDPAAWLSCPPEAQYVDSASTSSSMRSADTAETQSPYMDARRHYQNVQQQLQQQQQQQQQHQQQQQPIYENQQQIEQHKRMWNQRQEIPYLELDLRNRNVPEYVVQQQMHSQNKYYDPNSGVIMTQAGYITIPSGQNDHPPAQEKSKKLKRGNTLKSAMNSVSNWLPEFNLTRRHRSYSLPGVKREDVEKTKSYSKSNVGSRKKKRHNIVSTVSGILQKAKKKTGMQSYAQSLSDPEQSDNEWVMQRAGSVVSEDDRSEDNFSMYSESVMERDLFAKISKPKPTRGNGQESHMKISDDERQLQTLFEPIKVSPQHSDKTSKAGSDNGLNIEEEFSGKSTGSGSSNIFQTIGENKRSSGSSEKSDETIITESKMVLVVGGSSTEFAVSRALGKYRQRQSSSISDDQPPNDEQGVTIEEIVDEPKPQPTIPAPPPPPLATAISPSAPIPIEKLPEQKSTESHVSELSKSFSNEEPPAITHGSPSSASLKSHLGRYMPKHQQSLEIPGHRGDDEDNRSTHSWKSTSRVSSRRQSTEDSIDSEDEWYCYELRKLEEMERQTQLEVDMGATLQEEPEPEEEEPYEPYEEVKEKMSFVLRELRMKAKVVEGVLDEKDNNLHVIQSANRRGSNRGSFQLDNAASLFEKVKIHRDDEDDMMQELEMIEQEMKEDKMKFDARQDEQVRLDVPKIEEEHSSGDTSGPDSPHHSTDEYDENEMAINEEFARCYITKEEKEAEELKASLEAAANAEELQDESIPKIQVDTSTPKDEPPKEGGPLGSKWKLLKTLKERKAEEKNTQKTTETTTTDKVSMLGMMQKFYEIHVKT